MTLGTVRYIGTSTSFTDNGLSAGTQYWYQVYTVDKAFNYSAGAGGNGTTSPASGSTASDIISGGNETSNINYAGYQASSISTTSDALRVFSFTIRDGGGSPDGDTYPTILTSITIDKGGSNTVSSWASTIREAALFDGSTKVAEISVSGETMAFTGLSGANVTAPDDGSKTLDLYLTFESTVTDNLQYQFQITSANVTNASSSSSSFTAFSTVLSNVTGDNDRLEVTATKLSFVQQPSNVAVGLAMIPAVTVSANDVNNNRDLDYVTEVSITANGATLSGSPVVSTPASGLATFSTLTFTTSGNNVTLDAASGSLAGGTSNTFNVEVAPVAGEIVINQFSPDYNGASDEYVELINETNKSFDLSLLKIEYQSAGGVGGGGAGGQLSGTIGPYQFWLLSPNATITVGQTSGLARDGGITAGFAFPSGQLALRLYNSPNAIIDGLAYGTITTNNFGEGSPASSPPADGGLKRSPEGADNNNNSADFTTVAQANIYLHNHNSICIINSYTVPGTSYSDISLSVGSPQVVLSGNTSVSGRLSVYSGNLTVGSTQTLTVGGTTTLTGTACLILKSDASGTASFIDNGITGTYTAKVERYLVTDKHHYISSPISDATANVFLGDCLRTSDPTNPGPVPPAGWGPYISDPSATLTVMRGYDCWKPASNGGLETFTGSLNTGNKSIILNRTATDPYAGWHLVGNPYPSSLDLNSGNITWDNFETTAWLWSGAAGNYTSYPVGGSGTHSQYVPPEQGFFVHIKSSYEGSSTLSLTNGARVHNSEAFLKDAPVIQNALLITATGSVNGYSDKLSVHFNPGATSGYDPGYDAYKLYGLHEAPQIYTKITDTKVTCNSLPFAQKNMVIPMGFSCGLAGQYTLTAENLTSFEGNIEITLEDLKLSTTRDLRLNPVYTFAYDTLDNPDRFLLHFYNPSFGVQDQKSDNRVQIYSFGSSLFIRSTDGTLLSGNDFIYDMTGRELYHGQLSGTTLARITPGISEGYYVVKVVTKDRVYTGKIYLASW